MVVGWRWGTQLFKRTVYSTWVLIGGSERARFIIPIDALYKTTKGFDKLCIAVVSNQGATVPDHGSFIMGHTKSITNLRLLHEFWLHSAWHSLTCYNIVKNHHHDANLISVEHLNNLTYETANQLNYVKYMLLLGPWTRPLSFNCSDCIL